MATYIKIASNTVGAGGAASVTFSSIPAIYTDLVIKMSARGASSGGGTSGAWDNFNIQINSTNGTSRILYSTDSSTANTGSASYSLVYGYTDYAGATTSTFSNNEVYIPNYTSSNGKSMSMDGVTETNGTATALALTAGLYSTVTSAVTSVKFTPGTGNFAQYSTFTLYGISNA